MPAATTAAATAGRKWSNPNSGRKRSSTGKTQKVEESDCVIPRHEFLAGRVVAMQKQNSQSQPLYRLRTESIAVLSPLESIAAASPTEVGSPTIQPAPPPGLELPCESDAVPEKEPEPVVEPKPQEFKVLLQNLPEAMLKECMLRVMLEQAKLKDITSLAFRANGKALITFATYASVVQCINHFCGRRWGSSTLPVTATYVKTVSRGRAQSENDVQKQEPAAKKERTMSADAAVFVPGSFQLSADAPIFVPPATKIGERDRFDSYASTDVGPEEAVEGCDSESDPQVVCTQ